MAKTEVFPVVHAEREALAADLEGAAPGAWDTPSLCGEWSVRDVVAHMVATARMSGPRFFAKLVGSGFSFSRLQSKDIAAERGSSPAEALSRFRSVITSTGGPPGPADAILGETLVHAEDIRRPLGIAHAYPLEALVRVADFYSGSNLLIGTKKRIAGVELQASDTAWRHGSGPAVTGPMLSLVMAMTGRSSALDDLSGEGVTVLRSHSE